MHFVVLILEIYQNHVQVCGIPLKCQAYLKRWLDWITNGIIYTIVRHLPADQLFLVPGYRQWKSKMYQQLSRSQKTEISAPDSHVFVSSRQKIIKVQQTFSFKNTKSLEVNQDLLIFYPKEIHSCFLSCVSRKLLIELKKSLKSGPRGSKGCNWLWKRNHTEPTIS